MKRLKRAIVIGCLGALLAFLGLAVEHYANTRESTKEMLSIEEKTWWLSLPCIPGEAIVIRITPRDFMFDESWGTYKWQIIIWNSAVYFLFALSLPVKKRKKTPNQSSTGHDPGGEPKGSGRNMLTFSRNPPQFL